MAQKFSGKKLKEARKNAGLTQEQLQQGLFLGDTQLSRYERGLQVPNVEYLKKICDYIGVDMNTLFEEKDGG